MPRRNIFSRARMGKNVGTFEAKRLGVFEKQFDLFEKELILFMVSGFFQVDVPEIFRFALDDNKRARGRKIFGVRVKRGWQESFHPIYPVSQRVKSR